MPFYVTFAFSPGIRREYAVRADTLGENDEIETREYIVSTIDLGLRTSKQLTRNMRSEAEIILQKVSIPGISDATLDTLKQAGEISVKRKLVLRLDRDTRNNLLLPIRGTIFHVDMEYVGGILGGDDDFVKLAANWSRYQNFYGSNIYAWNYRAGWVIGTARDPRVPVTDRFVIGGGRSIRGYTSLEIAAVGAEVARGQVLIQTNQEIRRPLVWKLWASVFLDVGNIYEDFKDIRWDNLLVSGGAGIQYISPVGPIRLDYGHRLIHDDYEKGGRFHISILYAF
jgi:outer membrane protein insertion porin family